MLFPELLVAGILAVLAFAVLTVYGLVRDRRQAVQDDYQRSLHAEFEEARKADEFRRPAEWGPLRLPWDELERIKLAIAVDQLESQDYYSRWSREERAWRVWEWLEHQRDDVLALTVAAPGGYVKGWQPA